MIPKEQQGDSEELDETPDQESTEEGGASDAFQQEVQALIDTATPEQLSYISAQVKQKMADAQPDFSTDDMPT